MLHLAPETVADALQMSSIDIYYDQLTRHDWSYQWSRNPLAFREEKRAHQKLRAGRELSRQHRELFDAFERHHIAQNYQLQTVPPLPERPL